MWGRVASSFSRCLYLPSVANGYAFAAGWIMSEHSVRASSRTRTVNLPHVRHALLPLCHLALESSTLLISNQNIEIIPKSGLSFCSLFSRCFELEGLKRCRIMQYIFFLQDDTHTELAEKFDIDGTYVPRIYFLGKLKFLMTKITYVADFEK